MWNNDVEIMFFKEALRSFASPEQLFYKLQSGYFAYIPKGVSAEGQTLQSRNSLIGQFTEKWCKALFEPIAKKLGLYAVNGVICDELGLSKQTSADLAFCTTNETKQKAENIKLLFEIKMSVVSNYMLKDSEVIECIGDFKEHKGQPSLMRSDTMLKAIGKAINIRVSGVSSAKIPIVILGNSPISDSYVKKVDFLKTSGVVQGFLSLNPTPTTTEFQRFSPKKGFQTMYSEEQLFDFCEEMVSSDINYFSSMLSKAKLGELITIANNENTDIAKAEKFLTLIRGD